MRVTEQIDALTTLSTHPMKYLTLPRVLAATLVVPVLAAVGDIIGIMGGYLLMFPRARIDILFIIVIIIRVVPVPAWVMLGVWFGLQVFNGTVTQSGGGGVAYWAHAGGFVIGFVLMLPVWIARGGPAFWKRTHGHPDHAEARYRIVRTDMPKVTRSRAARPNSVSP